VLYSPAGTATLKPRPTRLRQSLILADSGRRCPAAFPGERLAFAADMLAIATARSARSQSGAVAMLIDPGACQGCRRSTPQPGLNFSRMMLDAGDGGGA